MNYTYLQKWWQMSKIVISKVQTINHILDVIIWWIKLRKFAPIIIESQNQTIGISFLL